MPIKTSPQTFYLPRLDETFSVLPDNGTNPNYSEVRPKSRAWINKYTKIVCGPKMMAFMDNCEFELSTAYVFPYAGPTTLLATMDLVSFQSSTSTSRYINVVLRQTFFGSMTSSRIPNLVKRPSRRLESLTSPFTIDPTTTARGFVT